MKFVFFCNIVIFLFCLIFTIINIIEANFVISLMLLVPLGLSIFNIVSFIRESAVKK